MVGAHGGSVGNWQRARGGVGEARSGDRASTRREVASGRRRAKAVGGGSSGAGTPVRWSSTAARGSGAGCLATLENGRGWGSRSRGVGVRAGGVGGSCGATGMIPIQIWIDGGSGGGCPRVRSGWGIREGNLGQVDWPDREWLAGPRPSRLGLLFSFYLSFLFIFFSVFSLFPIVLVFVKYILGI